MNDDYQITTDGTTVWVNHSQGYMIGRFGRMGVDIHRTLEDQITTGSECLACTHGPVTVQDWELFVSGMQTHYGIAVTDHYRPVRFR